MSKLEFRSVRLIDRLPLLAAKLFCGLLMVWCSYLCVVADELTVRMQQLSYVLSFTFFYANLATIKYELRDFFEPPYLLIGYPMAALSFLMSLWAIYL